MGYGEVTVALNGTTWNRLAVVTCRMKVPSRYSVTYSTPVAAAGILICCHNEVRAIPRPSQALVLSWTAVRVCLVSRLLCRAKR